MNIDKTKKIWQVKCSRGEWIDLFLENNEVSIGFSFLDAVTNYSTKESLKESDKFIGTPTYGSHGQLYRFGNEMISGDYVVTYDPTLRVYYVGILGSYSFNKREEKPNHIREVNWLNKSNPISKDLFSKSSQYSLGSLLTVTLLREDVKKELISILIGEKQKIIEEESPEEFLDIDIDENSREDIKKKILDITPENMELFIAGIFRAMGYKTKQQGSFTQADGGYDIVASRDGLGLDNDSVFIEVKHRNTQMTASDVDRLRGALNGKRGVYFSSRGFSKDARNNNSMTGNITLVDLDYLIDLIFDNYENFDSKTRNFLPLKKTYILES